MLPMCTLYSWYQYESLRKRCKSRKNGWRIYEYLWKCTSEPTESYLHWLQLPFSWQTGWPTCKQSLTRQTSICHSVSLWTKNSSYTPPTVGYFPWENVRLNPRIGQYWLCLDSESRKESTKVRAWATNQGLIFTVKDAWYTLGAPFLLPTMEEFLATQCRHLICIHQVQTITLVMASWGRAMLIYLYTIVSVESIL